MAPRFEHADQCTDGGALSYLRVGIVGAGYTVNLRERELETLLEAHTPNTATEVLGGERGRLGRAINGEHGRGR